ncbi:MAG: DUF5711 family protein [Oscillospiraceae bacterium]|nr:DUF5711 family protein [Oscillospiraceae bacterium]
MANENGMRNNKGRLNSAAFIRVLGAALLIVILVLAAAFVIGNKTTDDGKTNSEAVESGFDIGAASVKSVVPYSGGIAAIADSAVYYFDASGNQLSKNEHSFASPVAEASGRNLILYDLGGYKYRIEKRGGIYYETETASVITCAAIGKSGNYAYSLNSDGGYQSHLLVYSGRNKKVFEWGSSSDYISALTLSDNGKYCAAGVLTSENAKIVSVVKLFGFNTAEPLFSVDFAGSVVYDIAFASSKKLVVFCNDGVYSVGTDGSKELTVSYSSNEIKHFDNCPSGLKALTIAVFGNENNTRIVVLNRRGKQLFEKTFTEDVSDIICSKNRVSVVLRNRIESYDQKGNSVGLVYLKENASSAVLSRSRLYVLCANGLYSFSSNTHISFAENETEKTDVASDVSEKYAQVGETGMSVSNEIKSSESILPENTGEVG